MFKFLQKLFKTRGDNHKASSTKQTSADEIRKYTKVNFITPARQRAEKRVTFSAADIHKGLGLSARYPQVCAAIDAHKFNEFARVKLIKREGVKQGASARWTFKLD